jgi:hypothetical protein
VLFVGKWGNGGVRNVTPHILISAEGRRKEMVGGRLASWERTPVLADRSNLKWTVRFVEKSHAHARNQYPISFRPIRIVVTIND